MECSIAPRILILIFGRHILIWGGPNACKCGSVVARRAFWSPGPHEYCDAHNLRIADGHLHVRESGREGGGDYRVGEDLERKRGLQRTYHLPNGIGERHRRLPSGCCAYWTPRARSQVAWSGPTAGPSVVVVVAVAVVFVWFNEMTSTLRARGNDRPRPAGDPSRIKAGGAAWHEGIHCTRTRTTVWCGGVCVWGGRWQLGCGGVCGGVRSGRGRAWSPTSAVHRSGRGPGIRRRCQGWVGGPIGYIRSRVAPRTAGPDVNPQGWQAWASASCSSGALAVLWAETNR